MKIKYNQIDKWGLLLMLLVFVNISMTAFTMDKLNYISKNIISNNPTTTTIPSTSYDALAKCLTDNSFVMYGSQYCPHCADQKEMFGDSFKYIHYVECTEEPGYSECIAKNIMGVPTWMYDNKTLEGTQPLERLSQISGCYE